MFFKKKAGKKSMDFDPAHQKAVMRCSICNGEKVAGFVDLATGKFTEICLIKSDAELQDFMELYQLDHIEKIY